GEPLLARRELLLEPAHPGEFRLDRLLAHPRRGQVLLHRLHARDLALELPRELRARAALLPHAQLEIVLLAPELLDRPPPAVERRAVPREFRVVRRELLVGPRPPHPVPGLWSATPERRDGDQHRRDRTAGTRAPVRYPAPLLVRR